MKKLAIGFVLVLLAAASFHHLMGGASGLLAAALPEFPDLPAPLERLADEQRSGRVTFASRTPVDLDVILADPGSALATTGVGTLFVPEDATPAAPALGMIVLHGSGGISPGREMEYGSFLAEHGGIAALVLDYYEPRGVMQDTPYMLRVISVTEFDAVADAYAALALLATHPSVDGDRIGVVGFSYGGMAARFAMDERIRQALAPGHRGFAATVDYYGPCFQNLQTRRTNGGPLLTLRGTQDASNDLEACRKREDDLRALGVEVEAHVYPGAGHAWEVDMPRKVYDSPYVAGCEVRYDAAGRFSVGGAPIVDVPAGTPRAERIAVRMQSREPLRECLKEDGYLIGRDDATRQKSDAALLAFLRSALGAPAGG